MKVSSAIDLIIIHATIATASDVIPEQEIAISQGRIAFLGQALTSLFPDAPTLDAEGGYVCPGGVDSHVHLQQDNSPTGDTWRSGTRSAIAGGTTTVIAFASQKRTDESLFPVVEEYHRRAQGQAHADYGFHLILTNPTTKILDEELPALMRDGISSVKLYMTYDPMKLRDGELLKIFQTTRGLGMTTLVHAENADMIQWMTEKLEARGQTEPYSHALARPAIAEDEATYRAISLSELADVPILIVHVSSKAAAKHIRKAQTRLLNVLGETCPHYLLFTSEKLKGDGFSGAKCVCSPALREDPMHPQAMWDGLVNNTFSVVSSDHAPSKFDHPLGKRKGTSTFTQIPNGLPGVETRIPALFCSGVLTGRLSIQRFVQLTSSNAAKMFGLGASKGTIAPGYDADLVIFYPTADQMQTNRRGSAMKPFHLTNSHLHHDIDYTPFEGMRFSNWPRYTILRGKVVWSRDEGGIRGSPGDGAFFNERDDTRA